MEFNPVYLQGRTIDMVTLTEGDLILLLLVFVAVVFFLLGRSLRR